MKMSKKAYSDDDIAYIKRVAGKVPIDVIAQAIERTRNAVSVWCHRNGISYEVPYPRLKKHWPEHAARLMRGHHGAEDRQV